MLGYNGEAEQDVGRVEYRGILIDSSSYYLLYRYVQYHYIQYVYFLNAPAQT